MNYICKNNSESESNSVMPCSYCREKGHNIKTCPHKISDYLCADFIKSIEDEGYATDIGEDEGYATDIGEDEGYVTDNFMLISTNESQGHGKSFEIEIMQNVFGITVDKIKTIKHTSKYDLDKKYNSLTNRNVSIKTSGSNTIYCGDILRFLNSNELDIIVLFYKQYDGYKEVYKTNVIKWKTNSK